MPRARRAGYGSRIVSVEPLTETAPPSRLDHAHRHGRAEVAQVLAEHDRRGRVGHADDVDLLPAHGDGDLVEPAVPERRLDERGHAAVDRVDVRLHRRPFAGDVDAVVAEPLAAACGERERVRLAQHRVVAAALDPGGERELVQQLGDLRGRRLDHLDVAVGRRLELGRARERRREAVHGRERRADVVARERDEPGERRVVLHDGHSTLAISTRSSSDLQASAPEVAHRPVARRASPACRRRCASAAARREKLIAATIDCTVDLDPSQKGVHMSRFPELFEEAIDGVVDDEAFLVEELAEHVARRIVERQGAARRRGAASARATRTSARRR